MSEWLERLAERQKQQQRETMGDVLEYKTPEELDAEIDGEWQSLGDAVRNARDTAVKAAESRRHREANATAKFLQQPVIYASKTPDA